MKSVTCLILLAVCATVLAASGGKKKPNKFCVQYNKNRNACNCANHQCICCFITPGLGYQTCIKTKQLKSGKALQLDWTMQGISIINEDVRFSPKTEFCGQLPNKMTGINYCMTQTNAANDDGTIKSCTIFEFQAAYEADDNDVDPEENNDDESYDTDEAQCNIWMHCVNVGQDLTIIAPPSTNGVFNMKTTSNFNSTISKIRKRMSTKKLRYS